MLQPTSANHQSYSVTSRLWKTTDVATYLGMSARQVRKLVDAGKLSPIRIDHHLRFDRQQVDALIEQATAVQSQVVRDDVERVRPGRSSTDQTMLRPISM